MNLDRVALAHTHFDGSSQLWLKLSKNNLCLKLAHIAPSTKHDSWIAAGNWLPRSSLLQLSCYIFKDLLSSLRPNLCKHSGSWLLYMQVTLQDDSWGAKVIDCLCSSPGGFDYCLDSLICNKVQFLIKEVANSPENGSYITLPLDSRQHTLASKIIFHWSDLYIFRKKPYSASSSK